MFIVSLTYICELATVDNYLPSHVEYLKEQYNLGNFIASGRKVPRSGGVILSKVESLEELNEILAKDPFYINNLAKYEIEEFVPSIVLEGFENLQ